MSDLRSTVTAFLRADLGAEAAAAFPRLRRVPSTDVIWFLDYFAGQERAEREALLDGLAGLGALAFFPREAGPREVQELEGRHPAFARFRAPRNRMGYKGGTRYTDVKMLNMDRGMRDINYYHPDWVKNASPLAFEPRPDLLPDLSALKPAKAPLLRKLVDAALARRFAPQKEKLAGGSCKYSGPYGDGRLTVWVDFGARFTGQLVYGVSMAKAGYQVPVMRVSYERLWDANLGWDYLTEENAPRSIDFLAEQVANLADLADRLNAAAAAG